MKKLFTTLTLALATLAVSAQDNPNRLLVQPKQGNVKGFLVERIDSIYFTKVEGRVSADVNVQSFTTGDTGDTIRLAVTKTAACKSFKIACMTRAMANALTNDVAVESYFDQMGGATYTDDFTNAVMTGFDFEFQPNSDYSIVTLGYDQYGIACSSSRSDFSTPSANIIGNPSVSYSVLEANQQDFTIDFQPNADCSGYYICSFEKGTAEQQFEQWAPMMGFANMGDMIRQWSGKEYSGRESHKWTQMTPGTDYEVYVLPIDVDGNYGTMVIVPVTTTKYGGTGEAAVTITIGEFGSQGGQCYQYVTYTPNDQTSFMRDMIIEKKAFESADWGNGSTDYILNYLKKDDPMNPYWNIYGVDVAQWNVNANTDYIAFAIGQNINGEWGPLALQEFRTGSVNAPAKAKAVAERAAQPATNIFVAGKAPKTVKSAKNHRGVTLTEVK